MAIEKDFFRQVMGHFATGVTVVTTNNHGELAGLTVNAFCSVSLDPPLVLVCVDLSSTTLSHMRDSGIFAVNILTDKQEELSSCFATSSSERYENFCYAEHHVATTGAPIIDGALAFIDARIVAEYPGGDHVIFLGQVEAIGTTDYVAFANGAASEHATVVANVDTLSADLDHQPLAYYRCQHLHLPTAYLKPSLST